MQSILVYLMLLLTGTVTQAQNTIEVSMTNFDHDRGTVMVGLYDEEGDFLDKTMRSLSSRIEGGEAKVTFTDVPDGVYAVSCYHDKDGNGKLNMFLGIFPTESYGTSNNAPARFGPPKWKDAKFEVKNGEVKSLDIRL